MKPATKLKTQLTETTPIHQIVSLAREQLAALDAKKLLRIQQETITRYREAKALKDWVDEAIALKYQDLSRTLRQQLRKDTGTMHFDDHGVKITEQLPKRVEWDQAALAEIAEELRAHGQTPSDYMRLEYKISENDYKAWPQIIQNTFQRARTVKAGKSTWTLSADAAAVESVAIHPTHHTKEQAS